MMKTDGITAILIVDTPDTQVMEFTHDCLTGVTVEVRADHGIYGQNKWRIGLSCHSVNFDLVESASLFSYLWTCAAIYASKLRTEKTV